MKAFGILAREARRQKPRERTTMQTDEIMPGTEAFYAQRLNADAYAEGEV